MPFADELRVGFRGQTRRVLAPKGVKVMQPLQLEYTWRYLLLAVSPLTGTLQWQWIDRMRQEALKPAERVFEEVRRRIEGVVYGSLDAKQAEAKRYLQNLQADPDAVKRLCGWGWLRDALQTLPSQSGAVIWANY